MGLLTFAWEDSMSEIGIFQQRDSSARGICTIWTGVRLKSAAQAWGKAVL